MSYFEPARRYPEGEPIICREYCPAVRNNTPSTSSGLETDTVIPDEVLGPDGDWMGTDQWIELVASQWTRMGGSPGSDEGVRVISFMEVLLHRCFKHSEYTQAVETLTHQVDAFKKLGSFRARGAAIVASLGNWEHDPEEEDYHALRALLSTRAVQIPWEEYVRTNLDLGLHTQNPLWPRVQWYLANKNHDLGYSDWERLGAGDWDRPIDKSGWTHEDHACRFILHFYDLLQDPELDAEHIAHETLVREQRIGCRIAECYDTRDKAWFGYSLFCLLIRGWQYKQQGTPWTGSGGAEMLVPALHENYVPDRDLEFPPIQVGVVNLSPFSPWVYRDDMPRNIDYADETENDSRRRQARKNLFRRLGEGDGDVEDDEDEDEDDDDVEYVI